MNIILLSKVRKHPLNIHINRSALVVLLSAILVGLPLAAGSLGYTLASARLAERGAKPVAAHGEPMDQMAEQARVAVDALSMRLGELQARMIRLDALGKRLVETARLDKREFNFENPPAVGGPEDVSTLEAMDLPDFLSALDQLSRHVDDREYQLGAADTLMFSQSIAEQTSPSGKPVGSGYISSSFGKRADPFSGQMAFHAGTDYAGIEGDRVVAVAAGVVTWSGDRYGYGNLVEVDHGNGYVTRYAHNKRNLVKTGELVKKGQAVAQMGSTGRSTGPHVHFEILRDGKPIDPVKFMRAAR